MSYVREKVWAAKLELDAAMAQLRMLGRWYELGRLAVVEAELDSFAKVLEGVERAQGGVKDAS